MKGKVRLDRGYTMLTPQTERWNGYQWMDNEQIERMMLFVGQTEKDFGRSRILVARFDIESRLLKYKEKVNSAHPAMYGPLIQWMKSQPETNQYSGWEGTLR